MLEIVRGDGGRSEHISRSSSDQGSRLRQLRKQRALSQSELAELVGVEPITVRRWERGETQPQPFHLRKLAEVFGIPLSELRLSEDEEDAGQEALELGRLLSASDVSCEMVEGAQLAVVQLRRRYSNVSSRSLVPELRRHLRVVGQLIKGRTALHQHRDLLQAGGWLALLLGTVYWDLKRRNNAFAYRDLAWQLSRQTGDQELEAWTYETPAWFALIEKRYREAVELSQGAQQASPRSNARVASLLQEGRAWARLGARSESIRAIRQASSLLEQLPPPTYQDDHYSVDPAKLNFFAGTCYALLGESREAERHARQVIASSSDPSGTSYWPARVAIAHIDVGLALAQRSEFDEAADHGAQAFGSPVCHRSTMQRAGELDERLKGHDDVAQVRDFHERLLQAQAAGVP